MTLINDVEIDDYLVSDVDDNGIGVDDSDYNSTIQQSLIDYQSTKNIRKKQDLLVATNSPSLN